MLKKVLIAFFISLASLAHAEVIELEGTIKSIDQDARAIAITRKTPKGEKVLELEVAKNAGDISSIENGDEVTITYDPDLELVASIAEKASGDELLVAGTEWASDDGGLRLRILSRDGTNFTGIVLVGKGGVREIKGSVKGEKIGWLAKDVTALSGKAGGDNAGVLTADGKGPRLDFTWTGANGTGGQFVLRKANKPDRNSPADSADEGSSAVSGVYDITWAEQGGKQGTIQYEFQEDGTVVRAGKEMGSWNFADGVVQVRFDDSSRGFAVLRVLTPQTLEGTHTKGDGSKSTWKAKRLK
jgi:hypothetical protein